MLQTFDEYVQEYAPETQHLPFGPKDSHHAVILHHYILHTTFLYQL